MLRIVNRPNEVYCKQAISNERTNGRTDKSYEVCPLPNISSWSMGSKSSASSSDRRVSSIHSEFASKSDCLPEALEVEKMTGFGLKISAGIAESLTDGGQIQSGVEWRSGAAGLIAVTASHAAG